MIHILKYSLLTMMILMYSCTKDFESINTNPNAPLDVEASFLLRQVIYDYGEQMSYEGFVAGNLLGQYFTAVDFNLFDRHSLNEPQFGGNPWPILYKNLRDNEILLSKAMTNDKDKIYEGPARILKAFLTANLTDLYGDVPYSESLQGKDGNTTPRYDDQASIYLGSNGILNQIEQGIQAIKDYDGNQSLEGDLLHEGELNKWIRFGQSLTLKYLVRISDKENVAERIQALIDEDTFILENDQNASFYFSDTPPNTFRLATARTGDFNLFILSETYEDILKTINDARLETFFRPNINMEYEGLLNGPDASTTSISISNYSLSGKIFREETSNLQANFMTAWEVQFLLAEASFKGLIQGDAKQYYENGIALSFEYWKTNLDVDYLESENVAYDENNGLQQIITQKWISHITNGYEGWIEYRRTGFPILKTIDASLNNDLIPVRMPYPTDEAALNAEQYNVAASNTDNNSINSPVWWDIN